MVAIDLGVFDVIPGASAAAVTPLAGSPVTTTVQWFQEEATPAEQAIGAGAASSINRRVVAYVRRDECPNLPMGSTIVGGPAHHQKTWRVHSVDTSDQDYHIAVVV